MNRRTKLLDLRHISLADVARLADVSTATVSRVLNGSASVSREKQEAVHRAREALGYVANGAARALVSQRSKTIGAVVPTLATETFSRPLAVFQRTVHRAGYTLLLANSDFDPATELREVTTMLEHGVDGLMVVGQRHDPKMWLRIESKGTPYVQAWSLDADRPSVGFDNIAAAHEVAEYLLALGHVRFGMIVGTPPSNDRAFLRISGTREALGRQGLTLEPHCLIDSAFSLDQARCGMRRLMTQDAPPTAIICANDMLAFGAMLEAQAMGLRIPQDVSLMGFNDFDYAAHLRPALSTMHVALHDMGQAAGDYLIAQLNGQSCPAVTRVRTELIIRDSTDRPPGKRRSTRRKSGH